MEQSLENIKIGDTVIFTMGGWYSRTIVAKVTRVTPKQFGVNEYRFNKKDGAMVGDRFTICRFATKEDVENYKREQRCIFLRNRISTFFKSDKRNSLTIEELEKIESIIKTKLK